MAISLDALSHKELLALKKDIDKTLDGLEKRQFEAARSHLEAEAKALGYKLADFTGATSSKPFKPRGKVAPKYRNPENSDQLWTGRGRKPLWVVAALEQGKNISDFAI